MKHSEKLAVEAAEQENDFTYMRLNKKSLRQARVEKFEDGYLEKLERTNCIVIPFDGTKVVIDTQTVKYGIVDYYPKANKILIRKKNKWIQAGLRWINENLLKNESR